jgi:molecular chaperone DnaK (HSP70)
MEKIKEIGNKNIIADFLSLINEYYFEKEKIKYDITCLSVPDFYTPNQKQELRLICESIGMKDINIYNESSSITMYYGYNKYRDLFLNEKMM